MSETIVASVESLPPVPDTGVQSSVATAEAVAEQETAARREADGVLKAASRAYVQGEKSYRAGLLKSGELAHDYLVRRMTLGDGRAAAVDTVRLELQRFSSGKVDVNRLVASYAAYDLLAVSQGMDQKPAKGHQPLAESVPYGHYRSAWSLVCDRVNKDTPQEAWVLLPGYEEECRAVFAKAVTNGLSRDACEELAKGLVRSYSNTQAAVKAEAAKAAREASHAAKDAADRVKAEAEAAKAELQAALDKAKAATDDKAKAEAEAAAKDASAKAEQASKDAAAAKAEADKAVKDAAKATVEEAKAVKAVERAVDREDRALQRAEAKTRPTVPVPEQRLENLLKIGKQSSVKDAAEFCVNVIAGHDCPDDVLAEVLRQLKRREDMSRTCKRACDAGLVRLSTDEMGQEAVNRMTAAVPA